MHRDAPPSHGHSLRGASRDVRARSIRIAGRRSGTRPRTASRRGPTHTRRDAARRRRQVHCRCRRLDAPSRRIARRERTLGRPRCRRSRAHRGRTSLQPPLHDRSSGTRQPQCGGRRRRSRRAGGVRNHRCRNSPRHRVARRPRSHANRNFRVDRAPAAGTRRQVASRSMTTLWTPRVDAVESSNMHRFLTLMGAVDTDAARRVALADQGEFWSAVWDFCGMQGERGNRASLVRESGPRGTSYFPDARLNVVDTLLQVREGDTTRDAIIEVDETGNRRTTTWGDLRHEVAVVTAALRNDGVGPGHRVAAWMPNVRETVVLFLAAMEIGATFTSTSADFGAHGVLERFGQTAPTVLLASSHYSYAGKRIDLTDTLAQIRAELPGLVRTVVVGECPDDATPWADYRGVAADGPRPRFDFDHPGTILYTSGTTGKPKCIVHRAAGVLLMHLKEQQLHCDVRRGDRVFYFTTCGWMMWNWLVSMLASGATIVLYDGSPTHPRIDHLWDLCESERFTLFGTSAKYIDAMKKNGVEPRSARDLSALRTVCSTGSPLAPDGFDWVHQQLGDVHLASISGGTDLCGCFVGGGPAKPVRRGE
ncbi:MAG: AMP-binding protein, partial [Ilumatobacteraceae bacterium]|nr:AMP-binding protein [Ilumatobacteraceae bacterium]